MGGKDLFIAGEAKLRFDDRRTKRKKDVFEELEEKVRAIREEYGEEEIVRIMSAHYATKGFIKKPRTGISLWFRVLSGRVQDPQGHGG